MDGLYAVEANLTLNDPFALNAIVWVKLQIIGPSGVIAEASTLSDPNHSNASTLTVSTTMRFNRNDQASFCLLTDVTSGTSMTENGTDVYHGSIALVGK
jgi:hypothetical protein